MCFQHLVHISKVDATESNFITCHELQLPTRGKGQFHIGTNQLRQSAISVLNVNIHSHVFATTNQNDTVNCR
jgi:hypothetical protein